MKELNPKKAFIQKHLNVDRLTSNQWDGILRIMDEYAQHYHDYMQSHPDIADTEKNVSIESVLLDIAIDVQEELLRQCKRAECDDLQTDLINENTISVFDLNKKKYIRRIAEAMQPETTELNCNCDNAWDTLSVIAKLVEAADILLHKKDYDGHGWEEMEYCYKRGLEILKTSAPPAGGE